MLWFHAPQISMNLLQNHFANLAEEIALFLDVSDFHFGALIRPLIPERYGNIIGAVELFANDTGAECVSVQPHHQVQHRGAVAGGDDTGVIVLRQDLLCQKEEPPRPLIEREADRIVHNNFLKAAFMVLLPPLKSHLLNRLVRDYNIEGKDRQITEYYV